MPNSQTRPYSSALRRRQQESTHVLIMEAVAALIAEGRIHSLSVQEVADRAAISYASVYRHFPSREKLFEGLYEWAGEFLRSRMPPMPGTLHEIPAWVEKSITVGERYSTVNQAMATVITALDISPQSRRRRDLEIQQLVKTNAPGLSPSKVRQASAIIRYLAGAQAWATLRQRFGLGPEETASALRWALQAFIGDLEHSRWDGRRKAKTEKEKVQS